jgi:DNA-binding NtrC family response regulator
VAYLVKPFDIDRLIEVTSEVVGLRQTEAERGAATDADGVELA